MLMKLLSSRHSQATEGINPTFLNLINHFFSLQIYLASDLTEIKSPKCISFIPSKC